LSETILPRIGGVSVGDGVSEGVGGIGDSDGVNVAVGSGVLLGIGVAVKRGVRLTIGASVAVGCSVTAVCAASHAASTSTPTKRRKENNCLIGTWYLGDIHSHPCQHSSKRCRMQNNTQTFFTSFLQMFV
jgi:hypothetical protein